MSVRCLRKARGEPVARSGPREGASYDRARSPAVGDRRAGAGQAAHRRTCHPSWNAAGAV